MILTLKQLIDFCEKKKTFSYSNIENPIVVSIPANFEYDSLTEGLMFGRVKVCHTLLNRNGSFISEENMRKAMPSLKYRPFLGHIHQLDDGTYDFHAHDMEILTDDNGNETINYIEKQIGAFTAKEPFLEYDEENDKTYVISEVAIPKDYTKAVEIIERKNGTKVSCEIAINEMSYNAKEKYLDIIDFVFLGATALGCEKDGTPIGEGMLGSRCDLQEFTLKEQNPYEVEDEQLNNLIERLAKVEETLASFNIQENSKEGGNMVDKLQELLEKYSKTREDLTFEIEGLSDEELEAKFKEEFDEVPASNEKENKEIKFSKVFGEKVVDFEISHEDIRYALYELIAQFDEEDNACYFIQSVFDDRFVMEDWYTETLYGCKYKVEDNNVSLDGDRYKLFKEYLTESEKTVLDEMRSNYSAIQTELNTYKKAELEAQKNKIFEDEAYSQYLDTDEFKQLIKDKDSYSLDELKDKAEITFAKCVKQKGTFSTDKKNNTERHMFSKATSKPKKKKPYGNIFA